MPPVAEFVIELASREGRITPTQIAEAEGQRAASADEFGELPSLADTMVRLGMVSEAELSELLANEFGLPFLRLTDLRVAGEVLGMINRDQALHYLVMPLQSGAESLRVAVADPLDLSSVDELGHVLGRAIGNIGCTEVGDSYCD